MLGASDSKIPYFFWGWFILPIVIHMVKAHTHEGPDWFPVKWNTWSHTFSSTWISSSESRQWLISWCNSSNLARKWWRCMTSHSWQTPTYSGLRNHSEPEVWRHSHVAVLFSIIAIISTFKPSPDVTSKSTTAHSSRPVMSVSCLIKVITSTYKPLPASPLKIHKFGCVWRHAFVFSRDQSGL